MFFSESVINTLVFGNINGCILLLEVLFFRWLLDGNKSHEWWAGVAIGLTLVVKPLLGPLLLLPLLNRQWRAVVAAIVVPLVFNAAAWPLISDPMNFVTRTVRYIFTTRDYFNSSIAGNGALLRPADMADPVAAHRLWRARSAVAVAAVPLLPAAGSIVLDGDVFGCAVDRVVPGALAWARATTR